MANSNDNKETILKENKKLKKEIKELENFKNIAENNAKDNVELKEKNKELENLIKNLNSKFEQVLAMKENKKEESITDDAGDIVEIPDNKRIKVMSRFNGTLNLFTNNEKVVYKFTKLWQIINIPYKEVCEIIIQNPNRFENGIFVILNDDIIKNKDMVEQYKKFLTKKEILSIIDDEHIDITEMLKDTTKHVIDTVVSLFTEKILNREYVDRNRIAELSKIIGYDLFKKTDMLIGIREASKK
jgi:hypothetical protein